MRFRRILPLLFAVCALFAVTASAQDFYWNSASTRSVALGGVYVPSDSDAIGALTTNPAGLSFLNNPTLDVNMSAIFARGSFSNSVNNNSQMTTPPGVIPYGAFGMPLGKSHFSVAAGFAPDLASVSDWKYQDAPGKGGVTYGLQENKSAILAGRAILGLSYAFGQKLSVGLTAGADYNENTLHAPYIFQSTPGLAGDKTLLDLHTYGTGWNMSVGAMFQPTKKLDVGVAWKSHTVIVTNGLASGNAYALFGSPTPIQATAFSYNASVKNILPQSVNANVAWHLNPHWVFAFQTDWVNWSNAFVNLPVTLTNGSNSAVPSTLVDGIPLNWKDQYSFHGGVERELWESASVRFGYAYGNSPVPSGTLTPMTAAIMTNQLSTGFAYHMGRSHFDIAYTYDPTSQQQVQQSGLLAGEYSNSAVRVGLQSVSLGYSFQF
ncbi:MAG TPA: outer membrane protein transport protein [Candidatus Saccharimonadales bacterium]|jgi:long-subunit fatty acid transport protein|nr:outer membrane protein transport protein [Candidatus Saccharimonadales bacterium]